MNSNDVYVGMRVVISEDVSQECWDSIGLYFEDMPDVVGRVYEIGHTDWNLLFPDGARRLTTSWGIKAESNMSHMGWFPAYSFERLVECMFEEVVNVD